MLLHFQQIFSSFEIVSYLRRKYHQLGEIRDDKLRIIIEKILECYTKFTIIFQ